MLGQIRLLLILHFLGLAMGFSTSFANAVMFGLITKAPPQEKAVLGRFLPIMSRVGTLGLLLLWISGGTMVWLKWGGFASLPPAFHVKLAAVVVLTLTVGYIHVLQSRVRSGDAGAFVRLPVFGKLASLAAFVALIFAVLSFT